MVHRDPTTGQFVSGSGSSHGQYKDIEVWNFDILLAFEDGETEFTTRDGTLLDIDQITDRRREEAHMLYGDTKFTLYGNGFGVRGAANVQIKTGETNITQLLGTSQTERIETSDSLDLVHRPVNLKIEGPDSDNVLISTDTMADPVFHPRNEITYSAEMQDIDIPAGTSMFLKISGQYVFGLKDAEGTGR